MSIDCPAGGDNVRVTVQGGGPAGTICAWGQVPGRSVQWMRESGRKVGIKVQVRSGHSLPLPSSPGGVDVSPQGDRWAVTGLSVPNSSPSPNSAPLTIHAWFMAGTGAPEVDTKEFHGQQGGGTDCCAGSG